MAIASVALLWFGSQILLFLIKGPNWVLIPQDLGYNYLFNGVNILRGDAAGTLIHPAITTIYYYAGLTWLIYQLFGAGELAAWVVGHLEFTSQCISYFTAFLGMLAFYVAGVLVWRGTGSVWLALLLLAQGFIHRPDSMVLNSFGAPESFLYLLAMLLAGVSALRLRAESQPPQPERVYLLLSSLICATALATKFTAAPFVLLPLLALRGWRHRLQFLALCAVWGLFYALPILLEPLNRAQFIEDLFSLVATTRNERAAAAAQTDTGVSILHLFDDVGLWAMALITAAMLGALLVARGKQSGRPALNAVAVRIALAAIAATLAGVLLILLRPKIHYVIAYTPFLALAMIAFVHAYARQQRPRVTTLPGGRITLAVCAAGCLYVAYHNLVAGGEILAMIRHDRLAIQARLPQDPTVERAAVIAAIPATNPYTAIAHANSTSRFRLLSLTRGVTPAHYYDFLFDGRSVRDSAGAIWTLADLALRYDRLYFWVRPFMQAGRQVPYAPALATLQPLIQGQMEQLSVMRHVALHTLYNPQSAPMEDALSAWTSGGCDASTGPCLTLRTRGVMGANLTRIRLRATDAQAARAMPRAWRVLGSQEGQAWRVLHTQLDGRSWRAGETRDIPIAHAGRFRQFRLLGVAPTSEPHGRRWPSQALLMSRPQDVGLRIYPGHGARLMTLAQWDAGALWSHTPVLEAVGAFPMTVARDMQKPRYVDHYLLGTGHDGVGARDAIGRMPTAWTLQGSNDGERWRTVDQRAQEAGWRPDEQRLYALSQPGAFRWWRLRVTRGAQQNVLRLYKARLLNMRDAQVPELRRQGGFLESATGLPVAIALDFDAPARPTRYQLEADIYAPEAMARAPFAWTLLGSSDGRRWRRLDQRRLTAPWRAGERRAFAIAAPQWVRHLRLVVTEVADHGGVMRLRNALFYSLAQDDAASAPPSEADGGAPSRRVQTESAGCCGS
ncbi:discoidin domain-containing protein [Magnetofaba australis]|uniref:discoidin domain-containing protein n=1 Tax=Magnetofaba australis TaxID=1472297 RepID=UPI000A19F14B|nr:discoidin domain-containing protein [Magnetofaba australis]